MGDAFPLPAPGSALVRRVDLRADEAEVARCRPILSPSERDRADRFHFERDRRRYTIAHARLREALSACCGAPPEAVSFGAAEGGKPFLLDGARPSPWQFNLSHSGDLALIAVAWKCEIGVDLERVDARVEVMALAERFFAPPERAWLRARPENAQPASFYQLWTCKEAVLKMLGSGLRAPLDAFAVLPQPDGTARLTALADGFGGPGINVWQVRLLDPAPGYAAALAAARALASVEWLDPRPD
jgi:4'-phosphopantetheinyl transferase